MIRATFDYRSQSLTGAARQELETYYNGDILRGMLLCGIDRFVCDNRQLLTGRVLDFGCGKPGTCRKPQPYRRYVTGEYLGFDVGDTLPIANYPFDTILCTEVLMYVDNPRVELRNMLALLAPGGSLLLTYTAAWPEIEETSLWRFTAKGVELLLKCLGFVDVKTEALAEMRVDRNTFVLGHGTTCRKP